MIAAYEVPVIPARQKSRYVHRQLTAGASRNGADQAQQRRCCSYCAAADCFLAFGFGDSRRIPFTATLLRFTYALRRFRLVLTRCCWPMRCSIDALRNRRNGQPGEHGNAETLIIGLRFPAECGYNNCCESPPMTFPITPKNLIGLSAVLLMLAVVFGVLNTQKLKSLRASAFNTVASVDNSERRHFAQERESKAREASLASKFSEMEGRTARAAAELAKVQADNAELQSKLQANEAQIAARQRPADETSARPSANPGAPTTIELQAQLEETRTQLAAAEREKMLLLNKIHGAQERSPQLEDEKKQRDTAAKRTGIHGTILAVNQAYNFVVLNLGGRQGVELNAEMLVIRNGAFIGKIRVSSVEPFTAIGDIITSSLARGVQVQPGDIVIYAGNS